MAVNDIILITGCSTGFGRIIAEALARKGCRVFAGIRDVNGRNVVHASDIRELAQRESLMLHPLELDVTSDASVNLAIEKVMSEAGCIDVLVNNAGVSIRGLCEAVTLDQMRRVFETNVFAVQRMNRAVLPHMRSRHRGLLIHISSGAGRVVIPGFGVYGASKFALEALVESYRYELAGEGIESISVEPGAYDTPITQNADRAGDDARVATYGPGVDITNTMLVHLGKRRDPQEVAEVTLNLIDMPAGSRPLRTVVGHVGDFVPKVNEFTNTIQADVLSVFGLSSLTDFKAVETT